MTVTNVGDEAAKFHVDIRHTGGSYFLAPRELSAGETATFDLRQMQSGQEKDNKGNVLPQDITSGQFHWSVSPAPGTPKLMGRAEVVSVAERVSSSYSCPTCCPDSGPYGGFGGGSTLFIDGFAARSATGDYIDCYGYATRAGEIYMSRMWIEHSSIASINPTSGYSTEVKGLGVGETILWGEFDFTQWDTDGMDCYRWETAALVNEPIDVIAVRFTTAVQAFGVADFSEGFIGNYTAMLDLPNDSPPCTGSAFQLRVNFDRSSGATLYNSNDPRNVLSAPDDGQYRVNGGGLQDATSSTPYFNARLQRINPGNENRSIRFTAAGFTSTGTFSTTARVTIRCQ